MTLRITRSFSDDGLYIVSDAHRTRPMRAPELLRWLRRLGIKESDVASVANLAPAASLSLDAHQIEEFPGEWRAAS